MFIVAARFIRHPQQLHNLQVAHRVPSRLQRAGLHSLRPTSPHTARHCVYSSSWSSSDTVGPRQEPSPQRSAIDPFAILAAAALSGALVYLYSYTKSSCPAAHDCEDSEPSPPLDLLINAMASSDLPPGRPGNLTPEQEQKLKEMWVAVMDVFGVAHETTRTGGAATPSSTHEGDKKKSKGGRMSLFGSKKHEDEADDKHGQKEEFQQALASQTPEQIRDAFWSMSKHDNPDALLLRFLRARKWDVQAALVMLISTLHWREQEMHVDDEIMLRGEGHAIAESSSSNASNKKEGEDFMTQLRLGKSFLHGTDKAGRPCCFVRVRLHRQGEQTERSLERFTVYTIETCRLLLGPRVDTATIVFDMTDFSLANMDYTPVKFMIKCFEANYPESLGSVLVYKSPWLFQGIWKVIRGWLDPVVAGKVHFASNVDDLAAFIPREHIIKELGGEEQFTYKYTEPVGKEDARFEDTAARDKLLGERAEIVKEYEQETLNWIHEKATMGSRVSIAERLGRNYWQMDPYVRARSLYDRIGVLQEGGKVDPYPDPSSAAQSVKAEKAPIAETTDDDLD